MKYDNQIDMSVDNSNSMILRQLKPGSSVLEFGPATGYMTKYMSEELNCEVYCVELNPEAAQIAGKFAKEIVIGDIEDELWLEKLTVKEFDFIVFVDILEHLRNPQRAISLAASCLKPGGTILTSHRIFAPAGAIPSFAP